MGQSSLAGGPLNNALSRSSAAPNLHSFLCFQPMIHLTRIVAILDRILQTPNRLKKHNSILVYLFNL